MTRESHSARQRTVPWDVLVVCDDSVVCSTIRRVLEEVGLSVATASGAAAGLVHPAAGCCSLLLCDLVLPDGSGIDVIRSLGLQRPELPVVLITGHQDSEHEAAALAAGAAAFLAKPFKDSELLQAVKRVLGSGETAVREQRH